MVGHANMEQFCVCVFVMEDCVIQTKFTLVLLGLVIPAGFQVSQWICRCVCACVGERERREG